MSSFIIGIRNSSTVVSDAQVMAAVAAIQIQIDEHWEPAWKLSAKLRIMSTAQMSRKLGRSNPNFWIIEILDTSDSPGALGYHSEKRNGVPYGRVFAKTCIDSGYSWTVTLSHEVLEMIADPYVNLLATPTDANNHYLYAYEVGDPVESDASGYTISALGQNVLVSNFVLPGWFDSLSTGPYDYRNQLTGPFQVQSSGYAMVLDLGNKKIKWVAIRSDGTTTEHIDEDLATIERFRRIR